MKKAILAVLVASIFTACNNTTTTVTSTDSTKVDSTVDSTKVITDSIK
jgi:hypothetical protein